MASLDTNTQAVQQMLNSQSKLLVEWRTKTYETQAEAYQAIIDYIRRSPDKVKEAVMIQYSCITARDILVSLLRKGADVTLYIQHEDTARDIIIGQPKAKVGCDEQVNRIKTNCQGMKDGAVLYGSPIDKLKVYKYRVPASMNGVKIVMDNAYEETILIVGFYVYFHHDYLTSSPSGTLVVSKTASCWRLSGADRPAVVAWKGSDAFQALNHTFEAAVDDRNKYNEPFPLV